MDFNVNLEEIKKAVEFAVKKMALNEAFTKAKSLCPSWAKFGWSTGSFFSGILGVMALMELWKIYGGHETTPGQKSLEDE